MGEKAYFGAFETQNYWNTAIVDMVMGLLALLIGIDNWHA